MLENKIIGYEHDKTPILLKDLQTALKEMLRDVVDVLEKEDLKYFVCSGSLLGAVRHKDIIPWDDDIDLAFMLEDYDKFLKVLQERLSDKYFVQCYDTDNNYSTVQPIIKVRKKNTHTEYNAWYDRTRCDEKGIFIDLIAFSYVGKNKISEFIFRKGAFIRTLFLLGFNLIGINVKWLKQRHIKMAYKYNDLNRNSNEIGYAINFLSWVNLRLKVEWLEPYIKLKFGDIDIKGPKESQQILREWYGEYEKLPNIDNITLMHSKNLKLKSKL